MAEQVLKVLGKLDEQNTRSIIWIRLEQAKLIIYLILLVKHHKLVQGFRVASLFTGQYTTKGYDLITDVI